MREDPSSNLDFKTKISIDPISFLVFLNFPHFSLINGCEFSTCQLIVSARQLLSSEVWSGTGEKTTPRAWEL